LAPIYLFTGNFTIMAVAFSLQGLAGSGGMFGQVPSYFKERFPTEVGANPPAFLYHQGAIWGGVWDPAPGYFATLGGTGLAIPMLIGTVVGAASFIIALLLGPETRGKSLAGELSIA